MTKISKDTPLHEITLRRYEKPDAFEGRDLVRKLCLSLGLLQPGDSRDVIVDLLHVLLKTRKQKKSISSKQAEESVIALRKELGLPLLGVAPSNIRRQLKRLRDLFIIEKVKNEYQITEFLSLQEIFEEKIEKFLLASIKERVKDYLTFVDTTFT